MTDSTARDDFVGAKGAFLCDGAVLAYLRDERPGLPWAGWWDLPGGGREGRESPEDCLLRELDEEFGLRMPPARLIWRREMAAMADPTRISWFFGAEITRAEIAAIRFGDEGQHWRMMQVEEFLSHRRAVPQLRDRLALFLATAVIPPAI